MTSVLADYVLKRVKQNVLKLFDELFYSFLNIVFYYNSKHNLSD